ncbi:hypothetical protein KQX54_007923 [Cotesia glomerata]|uniref:Uncharacterized protein n=1 Tax=Cotesia glomerata TaxID=32391 RepID=A0AAV7I1Q9_COTGL|nr:hypothetical protein KQX54_007923 [Cotesia glomerata]
MDYELKSPNYGHLGVASVPRASGKNFSKSRQFIIDLVAQSAHQCLEKWSRYLGIHKTDKSKMSKTHKVKYSKENEPYIQGCQYRVPVSPQAPALPMYKTTHSVSLHPLFFSPAV